MRVLALDLGTKTGWALFDHGLITSNTKLLASEKELKAQKGAELDRCCDLRPARLDSLIASFESLDWIYFEDVQFLSSQLQAQLWASLRAMVSIRYPSVLIKAVPVGTLKKFASGHGNATKEMMAHALAMVLPASRVQAMDDNEVDAYHLLRMAMRDLKLSPK